MGSLYLYLLHESNLPFPTSCQPQKFCVYVQSWLNGICKQTKFLVKFRPDELEHSNDGHVTYCIPFHKIFLSVRDLHCNFALRLPMVSNCLSDGDGWAGADIGWHSVFLTSPQCQISPKCSLWEPHWYKLDRWKDMTKVTGAFHCYTHLCKNYAHVKTS
jgi:hypothetical protein